MIENLSAAPLGPRLTTPDQWREHLDAHIAEAAAVGSQPDRWLGSAPATAEEVEQAERRLGLQVSLPPSYRAFLQVTNGWDDAGGWIESVDSLDELQWLGEYSGLYAEYCEENDDEYSLLLGAALKVNHGPDFWLLCANEVRPDGEWSAYEFMPGLWQFTKVASFADLWHFHHSELRKAE
ncbi:MULTISPECIES: SMI1/KNR4 family protein [Nocardiopsidaceae]|uniref:SMI1/KNR4 family protein n=1 Tax=Streptomonospora nanhaiensis TaxID=1323731 RepID=A0ABY6YPR2_9ACTN|nr:SMI1/KNR4 family protein [Streptomonospora nanhaiensis]WAE74136.1 SMI1/KNR4 family protein [Streptomonospora nanhaiensis]